MKNISNIVKAKICIGCGTCFSACPSGCIRIEEDVRQGVYFPKIDECKCTNCGLCVKVCPQVDVESSGDLSPKDFFGGYNYCFSGYSNIKSHRYESSSGGLVTQICMFALEEKLVDRVIGVAPSISNPLRFKGKICSSREEIAACKGSKYCPVSLNQVLKEIIEDKNNSSYLYVGLPCHIKGLKKAMDVVPDLKNRIKYIFGLFCSHTPNFHGSEFILKKYHIKKESAKKISYRGKGWPGKMSIALPDGREHEIALTEYWGRYFANHYFTPRHCFICDDLFARGADISFGDAWLDVFKDDNLGTSVGVVRSPNGEYLVNKCLESGRIVLSPLDSEQVVLSQQGHTIFKNVLLSGRKNKLFKIKKNKLSIKLRLFNCLVMTNAQLSTQKWFKYILLKMNGRLEILYFKILNKTKFLLLK